MKHIIITIENNEKITGIFLDRFFYKELEPLVTKLGFSKHVDYSEFDRFHRKNVTFESFFSILNKQSPIGVTDMQFFNVENDELEDVLKSCNDRLLDENKPKNKIK